jgi:hypothetical protein
MSDYRACVLGADIVPGAGQPRHGPHFRKLQDKQEIFRGLDYIGLSGLRHRESALGYLGDHFLGGGHDVNAGAERRNDTR